MGNVPRKLTNSDPYSELSQRLEEVFVMVEAIQRASTLRNASVSGGSGIRMLQETTEDGQEPQLRIWINPQDGTITAYNLSTGEPAVRMGRLSTGGYGLEVQVNGTWVQLGDQKVAWSEISGKPSTYAPGAHKHAGGDITSPVANANNAGSSIEAGHAVDADGSKRAFDNNVSGTQFYAVWVGNDGNLGRNTSSRRYKENIRPASPDKGVLDVEVVRFDRKPQLNPPRVGIGPENLIQGSKDEYGVIAEQAHEHFPDATQWYDGKIDGVRYELYGAALIPIVREHEERLNKQQDQIDRLEKLVRELGGNP